MDVLGSFGGPFEPFVDGFWAGHGVAMGNALPEVIAVADEVAPTNNDEGIAVVIERLAVNGWRV